MTKKMVVFENLLGDSKLRLSRVWGSFVDIDTEIKAAPSMVLVPPLPQNTGLKNQQMCWGLWVIKSFYKSMHSKSKASQFQRYMNRV